MPTIQIFINTTRGDIQRAFVKSAAAATVDANPPALVVGNKRDVEVYLVDDAGNFDARSGAVGYSMAFGAGPVGAIPSGGTFTLSDGTNATAAIARNATAAQVQAALNAIDGGAGPYGKQVIVTTGAQGVYTVKFSSTGAVADLIGEASELTPESTVVVNQSIAGSATVKERQFIRLMREPVVYTDTFTPITNGWSGTLSANNARAIELMAGKSIIATDLDVELTASGGVPETIARGQIAIANEVINPLTLDAEELAIALTIAAGDARYLQRSNDLSDLASASAARGNLGLGNVDNTSDASKPVSTAQQAAIDLKADITALTAETDEREAADNRRAFSGGVYFSDTGERTILPPFLNKATLDPTTEKISVAFKTAYNAADSYSLVGSANVFSFSSYLRLRFGANGFYANIGNPTDGSVTSPRITLTEGKEYCFLWVLENGIGKTYIDGVLNSLTQDFTGLTSEELPLNIYNYSLGSNNGNEAYGGSISDLAVFSTALTSTQAAEIYRDGLQPWLAANPEYRRGNSTPSYTSDFSAGTDGWGGSGDEDGILVSQSITGVGGEINTIVAAVDTSNGVHVFWDDLDRYNGTGLFKIKVDVYIPSSQNIKGVQLSVSSNGSDSSHPILNPTLDSWTTYQSNEFIRTAADSNRIYFYLTDENGRNFTGNGTDFAHFKNIKITQVGALANLPLDDDSRQLKDISGNRNDATASETGVTHLIQKDIHSFRDDNADGTGGSYLIANSDILAENEVITGVTMDGRFYAATEAQDLTKRRIKLVTSGSHIEVKRSDGTTDDAANVTTHPASTTDFAVNVLTQRI